MVKKWQLHMVPNNTERRSPAWVTAVAATSQWKLEWARFS